MCYVQVQDIKNTYTCTLCFDVSPIRSCFSVRHECLRFLYKQINYYVFVKNANCCENLCQLFTIYNNYYYVYIRYLTKIRLCSVLFCSVLFCSVLSVESCINAGRQFAIHVVTHFICVLEADYNNHVDILQSGSGFVIEQKLIIL